MANLCSASSAEAAGTLPADGTVLMGNDVLLVAGTDPALLDFAAFAARTSGRDVVVLAPAVMCRQVVAPVEAWPLETASAAVLSAWRRNRRLAGVVLFLSNGRRHELVLDTVAEL